MLLCGRKAQGTEALLKPLQPLCINSVGRKKSRATGGLSTSWVAHDKSTRKVTCRENTKAEGEDVHVIVIGNSSIGKET